jgi:zinc transporter 2
MTDGHYHSHSHGGHGHSHHHGHDHHHRPQEDIETPLKKTKCEATTDKERRNEVLRKLKTASALCFTFFLVEVAGGILAGSLAILSDAAHLAADLSAFVVAISGSHIASLPASDSHTFGLKRTESLAALFSMVSLAILSIGLGVEAIRRAWVILCTNEEPMKVEGKLMSMIAFIGVMVNVILAYVLGEDHIHMVGSDHSHDHEHGAHGHSHSHHDDESNNLLCGPNEGSYSALNEVQHLDEVLPDCSENSPGASGPKKERNVNLHAAYIHVLADLAQSVVVLIAGLIIWARPSWQLADPICTLIFSIMVCYSTVGVIRSSLSVLLEEVPPGVDWEEIYDAISKVKGVSHVHDLHVWSISHGNFILSVHATADDSKQAFHDIKKLCNQRNISHLTVQLQPSNLVDCVTCTEGSIHQCR